MANSLSKRKGGAMIRLLWLPAVLVFSATAWALSPAHIVCQLKKFDNLSPLTGCAPGTIFVSQDDPRADFTSVHEAISSL